MIKSIFRRKTFKYTHSAIGCNIPEENRSNRSSGNRVTRLGQIRYRKKPKLSSKATGVKIKLARIFKSLRYCLAKKKKGLIHSLVKSVTKSQILKNLCQCLTARANITCYVAWATGQRGKKHDRSIEWAHSLMRPNPTQARIPGLPNSTSAGAHWLT